jgi:hypothetical protein
LFESVLPGNVHTDETPERLTVDVQNSAGAVRRFWGNAQRRQGLESIPHEFLIDLRAKFPPEPKPKHYACLVWRILRSNARRPIDLHGEAPPTDADACSPPSQSSTGAKSMPGTGQ